MSWQHWIVVAYFVINALGSIGLIGKERDPITPPVAIGMVIAYVMLIWAMVTG